VSSHLLNHHHSFSCQNYGDDIFIRFIENMNRIILLAILFNLFHPSSHTINHSVMAQTNKFSFTGRVVDESGAAISGTKITLRQKTNGFEREIISDSDGGFHFDALVSGDYKISVSNTGFSTTVDELVINQDLSKEIILRTGTITEKITVTATRTESSLLDTAVAVTVVDNKVLAERNLNTIGDIFRQLPGTTTVGEGPFQVRPKIRGLDSNRVLILVDGERLNHTRTSTSNSGIEIGLVDVDQIKTLEVVRGSGSVLYGTDALAGTINIITNDTLPLRESGFRFGGGFNGLFSSNETGRRGSAYLTGTGQKFAFRFSQALDRFGNYHSGAVPLRNGSSDDSDKATEVINSAYHSSSTQLTGRFFLSAFSSARANYERRRASNIGVAGVSGVFTAFFPFSNRDKVSGRYEIRNLNDKLAHISVNLYYQNQERNFSNITRVPASPPSFPGTFQFSETVTDTSTIGFDLQSNLVLSKNNLLTVGTSYFRDRNRDQRFIERLLPNFSTFPPSLTRTVDRSKSVPNANFANIAFFAQDEYQLTKWLRLVGGIRVDKFKLDAEQTNGFLLPPFFSKSQIEDLALVSLDKGLSTDNTAVSGDFGFVIKPTQTLSLTARVGRSFREPNIFERFFTDFGSSSGFVVGNPNLKPESGVNFDTALQVRTSKFAGAINYFNNTYTNFLTSRPAFDRNGRPIVIPGSPGRPSTPVFQTINRGRSRIQGLEASLEFSFPLSALLIAPSGSISYLRGDDLQLKLPLDFITPLKTVFALRLQDRPDRVWAEYGVRIINRQDRLSPAFLRTNGGAETGFVVHDLRTGFNLKSGLYKLGFTLAIENIGNRFYSEQFVVAPARGRTFSIGMNIRFF
jgi:hemoglobin/transferrin/lactoferrin receptor protein